MMESHLGFCRRARLIVVYMLPCYAMLCYAMLLYSSQHDLILVCRPHNKGARKTRKQSHYLCLFGLYVHTRDQEIRDSHSDLVLRYSIRIVP